jgi:hypothetical protein
MGHVVHPRVFWSRNIGALFFMLEWAWCGFHKKCARTLYVKHVFLQPVGSADHVVHFSASGARNGDALFSCSAWPGVVSIKSVPGHAMSNMCFCI